VPVHETWQRVVLNGSAVKTLAVQYRDRPPDAKVGSQGLGRSSPHSGGEGGDGFGLADNPSLYLYDLRALISAVGTLAGESAEHAIKIRSSGCSTERRTYGLRPRETTSRSGGGLVSPPAD
jgi:hypothetical protein